MAKFSDIAQLWATQAEKGPKVAGTAWRDGAVMGHHGTALARIVETDHGKIALVGRFGYTYGTNTSMLTNLAKCEARKAGLPVFMVATLDVTPGAHVKNMKAFSESAAEFDRKAERAKFPARQEAGAMAEREALDSYARHFGFSGQDVIEAIQGS